MDRYNTMTLFIQYVERTKMIKPGSLPPHLVGIFDIGKSSSFLRRSGI